jgi:hypothetical protein
VCIISKPGFEKIFQQGLLMAGLLLTCIASANEKNSKDISFSIKPGLCVLGSDESECRDTLHVKWKSQRHYSLCLYQKSSQQSLHCWPKAREGEHELEDQQILVAKAFTVLTRESRSRRRNPWSFF